jgi:hypothetical protein
MFVKHLQEYLDKFTEGPQGRRGNAVSNARIYIATPNGYLEEIRRIEVHESTTPGDTSIRVVLKPNKEEKLILPPGYIKEPRPSVRAPLNLLREIFTCTVVHASRSLWLKA